MARPASPTVRRRELASTLRALRIKSKRTLEEAASPLEMSAATLSRIETGIRVPRVRDVRDLLELYGVEDQQSVQRILSLVAEAKEPGWWEIYPDVDEEYANLIGLEAAASRIQQYEAMLVPGLTQTSEYARAYLREAINPALGNALPADEIEKRVEIRMRRQQVVFQNTDLAYEAIVDEASLLRPVGGREVMRRQIRRLLELAEQPHVSVRLLALGAGAHPGQLGGFTVLSLPQKVVADVVIVESPAGQLSLEDDAQGVTLRRNVWRVIHERASSEEDSVEALHRLASGGVPD